MDAWTARDYFIVLIFAPFLAFGKAWDKYNSEMSMQLSTSCGIADYLQQEIIEASQQL